VGVACVLVLTVNGDSGEVSGIPDPDAWRFVLSRVRESGLGSSYLTLKRWSTAQGWGTRQVSQMVGNSAAEVERTYSHLFDDERIDGALATKKR